MRGRCTLSSPLGDRLWEVPTRVSSYSCLPMETKQTVFYFIFWLDLSRLNIAALDPKDKTVRLFAFHYNVKMFSCRLKSWSLQVLQAHSRQCCQRWPGAYHPSCHRTNQGTKRLATGLRQLQHKCKTSDNRWSQANGGVEGENWGNIRECDMQGSRHISSSTVVKGFL